MASVRSLANLFCAKCNEITVHRAESCIHCSTPNQSSGNPPVPRPRFGVRKAFNLGDGAARRARSARHQHNQRGRA